MGLGSDLRPGAWATPLNDRWHEVRLNRRGDGTWRVNLGHDALARIDWAVPDLSRRAAVAPLTGTMSGNRATLTVAGGGAGSLPSGALQGEFRARLGEHLSNSVAAFQDAYGYARRGVGFAVVPVTPEDIGLAMPHRLGAPADGFALATGQAPEVRASGADHPGEPAGNGVPGSGDGRSDPLDLAAMEHETDRMHGIQPGVRDMQKWTAADGRTVTVISEWPAGFGILWWPLVAGANPVE
jgi:hypothetical protein